MNWPLAILSWMVAPYFGVGSLANAGLPSKTDLSRGDGFFVGLPLFCSLIEKLCLRHRRSSPQAAAENCEKYAKFYALQTHIVFKEVDPAKATHERPKDLRQ